MIPSGDELLFAVGDVDSEPTLEQYQVEFYELKTAVEDLTARMDHVRGFLVGHLEPGEGFTINDRAYMRKDIEVTRYPSGKSILEWIIKSEVNVVEDITNWIDRSKTVNIETRLEKMRGLKPDGNH